ncbi:MAG: hypothetical protein IT428_26730 [Planctomycetaceae bacterium]|nr:hypothetical protein [Planctomycetaceae bacterium]
MPIPWLERSSRVSWLCAVAILVASCGGTFFICQSGVPVSIAAEDEIRFQETVVKPEAPAVDPESPSVAPPPCNCWKNALAQPADYYLTGFAGASYFDSDPKTSAGGMAGLNLYVPIYGAFGFQARGLLNEYSGGTQYGGSVGLYKGSVAEEDLLSRLGGSVLLDQFTDTGFGDPYVVQAQYNLSYALTNDWRIGARYVDAIHFGDINLSSIVPGAATSAPVPLVDVVEANVTYGNSLMDFIQVGVGYIDEFESMTYRANIAKPVSDRWSASFATTYDEKIGRWSGFLGVQYDFSPRRPGLLTARHNSQRSNRDVVRGAASVIFSVTSMEASSEASGTGNPLTGSGDDLQDSISRGFQAGRQAVQSAFVGCSCPPGFSPSSGGLCVNNMNPMITVPCM